ncbi:MAG: DNA repair protein RecO [Bacteroidota bacterium]|nr:DNA repair protein RecO [Bacteroidota bacterium]
MQYQGAGGALIGTLVMLHTTRAIVLRTIRHGDSSVILKAFTQRSGLRSFVVRTGAKKGIRMAMLEPLNRLEMVVTENAERDLNNVREIRVLRPYTRIPYDPIRGTVALFIQEVLYKVLREESADDDLYLFVEEALEVMDQQEDIRHFPIQFLLQLSGHLGFLPEPPAQSEDRFDLKEGYFMTGDAPHGHTMGPPLSFALARLLTVDRFSPPPIPLPLEQRRQLLDHLLLYYRLHIEGLGELRSPAVLHQVLS